jgi:hypothetical protein
MRGAFKANPQRKRERENEPIVTEPIGDPPTTFTGDQLQAWNDIVNRCPKGVLTKADSIAVEGASRLLALERIGKASDAQGRRLDALLGKFGMTPSDRSKVSVAGKKKPESRWSDHGAS